MMQGDTAKDTSSISACLYCVQPIKYQQKYASIVRALYRVRKREVLIFGFVGGLCLFPCLREGAYKN